MAGHLTRTPEPLRKLNPDVPPALDAIDPQGAAPLSGEPLPVGGRAPARPRAPRRGRRRRRFDFSPEPPMGGMAAVDSTKRIWQLIAVVVALQLHSRVRIGDRTDGGAAMTIQWYVCSFVDVFGRTGSVVVPAASFDDAVAARHSVRRVRARRATRGVFESDMRLRPDPATRGRARGRAARWRGAR